jgi:STE24 endopeptidase
MTFIYPTLIMPLFNKIEPLDSGELRDRVVALAQKVEFSLDRLYTIDGSKRSGHSNAFFYGFFKNKRIVLYDTLITQLTTDEIIAVLAHELGHFKHGHVYKTFILTQLHLLVFFFTFSMAVSSRALYESFGFTTQPLFIGLVLFQFLFNPVDQVVGFLLHALTRAFEYQADNFACKLGYDLRVPLGKLQVENMGTMIPDKWYSTYHHTHPTLLERVRNIEKQLKRTQ